ncbi:MAG TPA: AAA family ATPase [Candidatus Cloacimonadota bacterium]|nr:AAA family ATPase [Candidatus Cloacimonadota bacterium]HPT70757.1 AAA family ATPase [Candidatus Cloacimonadota bacterium]
MKISRIDIQNFRKLKSCSIDFGDRETVFVGANNSGKTSAMDALIYFLAQKNKFKTTDFTLSNWNQINQIGIKWIENEKDKVDFAVDSWRIFSPFMDVWIDVDDNQINYVSHLIPTLSWKGGTLGVRLSYEPKNVESLYKDFVEKFNETKNAKDLSEEGDSLNLWPSSMKEYLDEELQNQFTIKAYLLDPIRFDETIVHPPFLYNDSMQIDGEPFKGLIKIDTINAQRELSDVNRDEGSSLRTSDKLSSQLKDYYQKHLDPYNSPDSSDIAVLKAIDEATQKFDIKLNQSFAKALTELQELGYPGLSDPKIELTSKVNPIELLDHDTAVKYSIGKKSDRGDPIISLPAQHNGLGYQNLISIVFKLIRFRDEWMRIGKSKNDSDPIEPLHIVLIEEPEAHLHAQVQQVFVRKAYKVLRNHERLGEKIAYQTQMVVSTHSSHIAHEIDFGKLRYFKKIKMERSEDVPYANIINLSTTFGNYNETSKFATRYLKTTHCDLFFADAVILVEGSAEKMLFPYFIKKEFNFLETRYISILEIGGSHAHRLKELIEILGIFTLVVTDIDTINEFSSNKEQPARNLRYRTRNNTLKNWIPKKEQYDDLLACSETDKIVKNVRVAYQTSFMIDFCDSKHEVFPYTFEDSLVLSNIDLFKNLSNATGLLNEMIKSINKESFDDMNENLFKALSEVGKADMALNLLYLKDPEELVPPFYIAEGLKWLEKCLSKIDDEFEVIEDKEDGTE